MEAILADVNWIAVIVGAIAAFALGAFWFSPKMFGTKWMKGVGVSEDDKSPMMHAMITQAVGTFLLAWVIGLTAAQENLFMAIMVGLMVTALIGANGMFAQKSAYAIKTEAGFVVAMVVIMVLVHAIL